MKCMLRVNSADKERVLKNTYYSVEQKEKDGCTYLWYYATKYAREDMADLETAGYEVTLLRGWENDGFIKLFA